MSKPSDVGSMKLPRYVRLRPSGTYRYQRNVPTHLRKQFGTKDIYRPLGNTYREMLINLPRVMSEVDAMLSATENVTERQRLLALVRHHFGEEASNNLSLDRVDEELEYALWDLGDKLEEPAIMSARLPKDVVSLSDAFAIYRDYKDADKNKKLSNSLNKTLEDLKEYIGRDRVTKIHIAELTRHDALAYRDGLLARVSPNSAERYINVVKAVVNHTINELGLTAINRFLNLKVKGAGHSKDARLPLSHSEIREIGELYNNNSTFKTIYRLLSETGARLNEIAGLEVQDVNLQERYLEIRVNSIRGVKTKNGIRKLPISQSATELLIEHRSGKSDSDGIFPTYAREGGSNTLSASMMKHFRKVNKDPRKSLHSLRHTKRDQLREIGCPEEISKILGGWSTSETSSKYGSGYSLELLRSWLEKTW